MICVFSTIVRCRDKDFKHKKRLEAFDCGMCRISWVDQIGILQILERMQQEKNAI